jgi:catechol 2,3-dioxygenase-like lactoylglutathione lyase family enzyme
MEVPAMLKDHPIHATIPCSDFARAKAFYADRLGLTPAEEQPGGAFYTGPNGSRFLLYPSGGAASGAHTQMGWSVDDIEAEVRDLKQRGVEFEAYDFPGFDKQTSISDAGPVRAAWFTDSEGNLLGIVQLQG